ncbi:MAG: hypothetical protein EOP41_07135 [Sphingobacteriaceae bacterium]|nr:MAG: hypothetical protein EOP41_07135 [Sphingobacteriaceae bacterium]
MDEVLLQPLDQLKTLLHNSNAFYLGHINNVGNYAYLNQYFIDRYGKLYDSMIDMPADIPTHPDDIAACLATNQKCMDEPEKCFPLTIRKINGEGYVITHWDYKAYRTADGSIDGVIGIGYDITEFESRKEHISFLTATIRDVALKQSHLIRKPLANIVGLVSMLEDMSDDDGIQSIVQMLKASTQELNDEFEGFLISDEPVKKELSPSAKLNML